MLLASAHYAKMRVRILVCLALSARLIAPAQATNSPAAARSLSLLQCIDLALSHNLDIVRLLI